MILFFNFIHLIFCLTPCIDTTSLLSNQNGYSNVNSLDLKDCIFSRVTLFNNKGGIIFITDISILMTISDCIFYNCSSIEGGAIFYSSTNDYSGCIINKTCSYRCYAQKYSFLFKLINSNKNIFLKLNSISESPNYSFETVDLFYGNQKIEFLNSSKNNCSYVAGFTESYSNQFYCYYSTFINNLLSQGIVNHFYGGNNNYLYFSNIINNNSPTRGIIDFHGSISNINNCIFYNNKNTLFNIYSSSTFYINNNIISHNFNIGTLTNNNNNSNLFFKTYLINHFFTKYCENNFKLYSKSNFNLYKFKLFLFNFLN